MKNNKLTWMRRLFDPTSYTFSSEWIAEWNNNVDEILKNDSVISVFILRLLITVNTKKTFSTFRSLNRFN